MVLTRPFQCPTRVHANRGYLEALRELVGGRTWTLVTSQGWRGRGVVGELASALSELVSIIDTVPANPTVSYIEAFADVPPSEVVVALGGGSVIDAAKGLLAMQALSGDSGALRDHLMHGTAMPHGFAAGPLISVPTTSGTGSEVTRWATIWGDERAKYSLVDPSLYPADAVMDPVLCVSMPRDLTLASGLDALSHAMEAVWNVNNTPVTDQLAHAAIGKLLRFLPKALDSPGHMASRREVQSASLLAGLAMGTTQTALAHSISYPFTANFGMPHGFACSFTLSEVARYNMEADAERLIPIAEAFGCAVSALPDEIAVWLKGVGLAPHLAKFIEPSVVDGLGDGIITRSRAANNIRPADGATARMLARRSLQALAGT